jgi:hypothetical protein
MASKPEFKPYSLRGDDEKRLERSILGFKKVTSLLNVNSYYKVCEDVMQIKFNKMQASLKMNNTIQ